MILEGLKAFCVDEQSYYQNRCDGGFEDVRDKVWKKQSEYQEKTKVIKIDESSLRNGGLSTFFCLKNFCEKMDKLKSFMISLLFLLEIVNAKKFKMNKMQDLSRLF